MKNVFAKILVLALCFTFALSSLVGCGKIKDQIADLQNQIDQNKNNDNADAAALAELKTLVEQIKATADSAATAAALDKVIADLAAVKGTADAAATAAKLAEVEAELKTLVETNGTADAAVKADLEAAIAGVKAIADAAATQAALEALEAAVNTEKNSVATELTNIKNSIATAETERTNLNKALDDLKAAVESNKTNIENELTAVYGELTGLINSGDEAMSAELATKYDELKGLIESGDAAVKAELLAAIAGVEATADAAYKKSAADLEAAKKELEGKLTTLETTVNGELEAVKALITANDAAVKAELEAAIAGVKATAEAAATKEALAEAVATLNAAVAKNTTALNDAVAALEAKIATDDELKAAVAEAVATLNKAIAANTAAIEANAAAIEANAAAIAKAATKDELAAAKAELAASVTTLGNKVAGDIESAIAALETKLQGNIDALEAKVNSAVEAMTGKITALESKDTELAGLIAGLEAQIKEIKAVIDEAHNAQNDFAQKFVEATKVLNGDAKVVVKLAEDGSVEKVVVVDADDILGDSYSIDTFKAITVDNRFYVPADYQAFLDYQENLVFFLTRAISVEAIVGYFQDLNAYITAMPELNETLAKMLAEKTTINPVEGELDAINEVVKLILDNKGELTPDNKAAYDALVAAYENLLLAVAAAPAVEAEIAKIGYVVYKDESMQAIKAANGAFGEYNKTYFANETNNSYYTVNATTLVANYNDLVAAEARYVQLGNAADDAVVLAITNKGLEYANDVRPLWTEKADLDAALTTFQAWCAQYNISEKADAETLAIIFHAAECGFNPVESLKVAVLHADAMHGIYTNTVFAEGIVGVEALNNAVVTLINSSETVLYTDYAVAQAYKGYYKTLKASIEFVKTFNLTDDNYTEMIKSIAVDFAVYCETQDALHNANLALDAEYTKYFERFQATIVDGVIVIPEYAVTFKDWDTIEKFYTDIKAIVEAVNVVDGDANYVAFAAENDPFALQDALVIKYMELTAKVAEIYRTVNNLLNNSNAIALTFGNNITGFLAELTNIMALGVTDIDLILPGSTVAENANLKDLMAKLETVIDAFCVKAEAAQLAAKDVAAEIATLTNYKTNNLNDYAAIKAVKAVLDAWVTEYLAADVADANGDVVKALQNVATVKVYLGASNEYYVFVTEADYTNGVTTMAAAQAHYDAASAAWTTLSDELERLTNLEWNIHNKEDFEKADAAYVKFVNDYYAGKIVVSVTTGENGLVVVGGEFGEVDVYAAFVAQRDKCYAYAKKATDEANTIKILIEALAGTINEENYDDQLELIKNINAKLEAYKQYCDNIYNDKCNDCISKDLLITLAEKEAIAKLYQYAVNAKVGATDEQKAEIDKSVKLYNGIIVEVDNGVRKINEVVETINYTLEAAKSAIDLKLETPAQPELQ